MGLLETGAEANVLLAEGGNNGQRVWLRIARAIDELRTVSDMQAAVGGERSSDMRVMVMTSSSVDLIQKNRVG